MADPTNIPEGYSRVTNWPCPHCRSRNVIAQRISPADTMVYSHYICLACGHAWWEECLHDLGEEEIC